MVTKVNHYMVSIMRHLLTLAIYIHNLHLKLTPEQTGKREMTLFAMQRKTNSNGTDVVTLQ